MPELYPLPEQPCRFCQDPECWDGCEAGKRHAQDGPARLATIFARVDAERSAAA